MSTSQWCHPTISSSVTLFSCPQSFPASGSLPMNRSLHQWPKYWSFSFSASPSNEYSGLISFRIDWLDLLAVQGTLKSLLQHHSSKALVFRHSAFFMVQFSHLDMSTGKTIALTFVCKVMSLLLDLSRFVIAFFPRRKHLLISWLQSPSAVILESKKIILVIVYTFSPPIFYEVMWLEAVIFIFWMLSFKPVFSLSYFLFIKRLFISLLSAIKVVLSAYLKLLILY